MDQVAGIGRVGQETGAFVGQLLFRELGWYERRAGLEILE